MTRRALRSRSQHTGSPIASVANRMQGQRGTRSSSRGLTPPHGSRRRYDKPHNCRCYVCTKANTERHRAQKEERYARCVILSSGRRFAAHLPPEAHGKRGTYVNHGCQCVPCTNAQTAGRTVNQSECAA